MLIHAVSTNRGAKWLIVHEHLLHNLELELISNTKEQSDLVKLIADLSVRIDDLNIYKKGLNRAIRHSIQSLPWQNNHIRGLIFEIPLDAACHIQLNSAAPRLVDSMTEAEQNKIIKQKDNLEAEFKVYSQQSVVTIKHRSEKEAQLEVLTKRKKEITTLIEKLDTEIRIGRCNPDDY